MSWDSDDLAKQLVEYCVSGRCTDYYAKSLAIRWLEKKLNDPNTTEVGKVLIEEKLNKLDANRGNSAQ